MSAARGRITEANTAVAPASGASEEGVTSDPNLERTSSKRPCVRENFSFASSAVSHPDYEKKTRFIFCLVETPNIKVCTLYMLTLRLKHTWIARIASKNVQVLSSSFRAITKVFGLQLQ